MKGKIIHSQYVVLVKSFCKKDVCIRLEKLLLEREESLKNLETQAILDIGNLSISGRYQYKVSRNKYFI